MPVFTKIGTRLFVILRGGLLSALGDEGDTPNIGPCLTAGWALQRWFWALYGATTPTEVLGADVATAPAHGGRSGAARRASPLFRAKEKNWDCRNALQSDKPPRPP
jgi:hypothetical protein